MRLQRSSLYRLSSKSPHFPVINCHLYALCIAWNYFQCCLWVLHIMDVNHLLKSIINFPMYLRHYTVALLLQRVGDIILGSSWSRRRCRTAQLDWWGHVQRRNSCHILCVRRQWLTIRKRFLEGFWAGFGVVSGVQEEGSEGLKKAYLIIVAPCCLGIIQSLLPCISVLSNSSRRLNEADRIRSWKKGK